MASRPALLAEAAATVAAAQAAAAARRLVRGPLRPSWSWRVELVAAGLRAIMLRSRRRGMHWLRAVVDAAPRTPSPLRDALVWSDVDAGGVRARWCMPRAGAEPARTIAFLHGGGYVFGSPRSHADLVERLAAGVGARVLAVDYRLAPEHRFPAAHDDCLAALRWLLAQGTDPARLALAGDSAGGALAAATLLGLRDAGAPTPAAAVLISPWTQPLAAGGSMDANADCDFATRDQLVAWIRQYASDEQIADPRITLVDAKLDGLPPLLVQAGSAEILLDQVVAFAERARAAGVDVTLDIEPDMYHDWQLQAGLLPEGAAAVERICAYLRARLAD